MDSLGGGEGVEGREWRRGRGRGREGEGVRGRGGEGGGEGEEGGGKEGRVYQVTFANLS